MATKRRKGDYEVKDAPGVSEDEKLLHLALEQFKSVSDAEEDNRSYELDDMRFRAASPDNKYQWPTQVRNQREADPNGQRPCLTINKIPQHVNQITNDFRQNRPGIKVIPVDDGADVEVADMLNGVIRHIEYSSDADIAYDTAMDNGTTAGRGYVRVLTRYVADDSFDQEIYIQRVRNHFTVYMDPQITQPDGSDARFCFVTEMMSKKEFEATYPDKTPSDWGVAGTGDWVGLWYQQDQIRVAEWWRKEFVDSELLLWSNGSKSFKDEDRPAGVTAVEKPVKTRKVRRTKIVMRKICGHCVLETNEWPGQYIPIARMVGNEYDIEGRLQTSGIVRNAKDAQRMYNYWASAEVEILALAPKAPFVGAAGQFNGFEQQWAAANIKNMPYLEYNMVVDSDGGQQPAPPPQRAQPPMPPAGFIQAKMGAADDIKTTTGQYDASLGAGGNETSGVAIMRRDHQSDVSTFHYADNMRRCMRYVGRIILDLFPHIYDTERVLRILGEDGTPDEARIDPSQAKAVMPIVDSFSNKEVGKIFNPSVGRYDVAVTTGPSYTTKRQEAAQAMVQMTQANPQLWQVIGDIMVRNMDWPGADEMAKRLKATLLPAIQAIEDGNDIPPEVQQKLEASDQEIKQLQQALMTALGKLQDKSAEEDTKRTETLIKAYTAETDRMKVLGPGFDANEVAKLAAQLVFQAMNTPAPGSVAADQSQATQAPIQPDMTQPDQAAGMQLPAPQPGAPIDGSPELQGAPQ